MLFFPFRLGFTFKKNVQPVHLSTQANIPPEQISHECVDFQTKMLSDHVGNFNSFARKKKFNSFLLLLQNSISFRWNDSILSTLHSVYYDVCLGIYCNYQCVLAAAASAPTAPTTNDFILMQHLNKFHLAKYFNSVDLLTQLFIAELFNSNDFCYFTK